MSMLRWLLPLQLVLLAAAPAMAAPQGKIGVFDLDAIHRTQLEPETISRSVKDGIVTEAIRFTSIPGVRPLLILTFREGTKRKPGLLIARRFIAEPRVADAKAGFVGISLAPPSGNLDPARMDALGGPNFDQQASFRQLYRLEPEDNMIYHHVVALTRALDYLETRPELDLAKTSIMGTEWAGLAVALMHAIDNRPAAYFVWHGMGYYSDLEGRSGPVPARISRAQYEAFAPAAYAQYGTKPIWIANGLNASESRFDALMAFAKGLRSPKVLAVAPNREMTETNVREFAGASAWQAQWTNPVSPAPSVSAPSLNVSGNRLTFRFRATGQARAWVLVSYGPEGNWMGRTWHRLPARAEGNEMVAELPVYDPEEPVYVLGQIETTRYGTLATDPIVAVPRVLGLSAPNAIAANELLGSDELYFATGAYLPGAASPAGRPSAALRTHWDGTVRLLNIEPQHWKNSTELVLVLQGDGGPGPISALFGNGTRNEVDRERQNYTRVELVPAEERFGPGWKTYRIPLSQIPELNRVDSLFLETGGRPLTIASIRWR